MQFKFFLWLMRMFKAPAKLYWRWVVNRYTISKKKLHYFFLAKTAHILSDHRECKRATRNKNFSFFSFLFIFVHSTRIVKLKFIYFVLVYWMLRWRSDIRLLVCNKKIYIFCVEKNFFSLCSVPGEWKIRKEHFSMLIEYWRRISYV